MVMWRLSDSHSKHGYLLKKMLV